MLNSTGPSPLSWHFCSEANTNKIEKIQEWALRFIYNDYNSTYESLLIVSKLKDVCVLKWFCNSFHSLAAAYQKDFRPYLVVRTEGISVMLSYLI
jgi:hypothetical protein